MKKILSNKHLNVLLLTLLLSAFLAIQGCQHKTTGDTTARNYYYTCSMHPQIHEDKPGNCPICGMKLIKVTTRDEIAQPLDSSLRYLVEPVTQTVIGNYNSVMPIKIDPTDTIYADGYTGFDERALNTVSARVSGRIEKLYVRYTNQTVHEGQPLMQLYSPQLLAIQRQLQQSLNDQDTAIAFSLEQDLINLGMYQKEIEQVIRTHRLIADITIYSPYAGISRQSEAMMDSQSTSTSPDQYISSPELLSLREGMYINAGQTIFAIQNINRIWAILNVFNEDLANIKQGDTVQLYALGDPVKIVYGQVNFIPPYRTGGEKTSRVRVYLSSQIPGWKIGTLLHAAIIVHHKVGGWYVPRSAVNFLGTDKVVWVVDKQHPHVYHATKVVTGEETGNRIQIISGIQDSDRIVENAAYMVDSDSFIQ